MSDMRMPSIFVGHGSPMISVEDNSLTRGLAKMGERVLNDFGKPKAILAISGHWSKNEHLVQRTEQPEQVFNMYGFPQRLYDVKYTPKGCAELSDAVLAIEGLNAKVDNTWGIDHGTWTPLVHMFPAYDIPIVQLSVNEALTPQECYEAGRLLAPLRNEGYLILGSGNVVHNLSHVNWRHRHGSPECVAFDDYICEAIQKRDDDVVIGYVSHPHAAYAVPTTEHFLPLLYILGAAEGEAPTVFNRECNLSAISMTSYAFGL